MKLVTPTATENVKQSPTCQIYVNPCRQDLFISSASNYVQLSTKLYIKGRENNLKRHSNYQNATQIDANVRNNRAFNICKTNMSDALMENLTTCTDRGLFKQKDGNSKKDSKLNATNTKHCNRRNIFGLTVDSIKLRKESVNLKMSS